MSDIFVIVELNKLNLEKLIKFLNEKEYQFNIIDLNKITDNIINEESRTFI